MGDNLAPKGVSSGSSTRVSRSSVGLLAVVRIVIRLRQHTVAVVRRVFVPGNRIVGKFLLPMLPRGIVGVILEVEQVIFLAAAAEQLDVARRIGSQRHRLCLFPQRIGPETGI